MELDSLGKDDQAYLSELTTFNMQRLEKEPHKLEVEHHRLQNEIEQLAVKNYRTFLKTAESVDAARNSVGAMDEQVDVLLEVAPKLSRSCSEFSETSKAIFSERKRNRVMAENQTQILELLEMPQLMSTCARNNLYKEALDLQEYAQALQRRHPNILILKKITEEMAITSKRMLKELTSMLENDIQLPVCLRIIGYLRRMDVFSEKELKSEFMKRRQVFLESRLGEIAHVSQSSSKKLSNDDAYDYISKYLDANRTLLREIITHYRGIFIEASQHDDSGYGSGLLFRWASDRVNDIISELGRILPFITKGSFLANILEQCMYCGLSLGHVGVDFRGLLPSLFEDHCISMFKTTLGNACKLFSDDLKSKDWHIASEVLIKLGITEPKRNNDATIVNEEQKRQQSESLNGDDEMELENDSNLISADSGNLNSSQRSLDPPQVLLEHPPLALFANRFINAVNELSQCAPRTIIWQICEVCDSSIRQISEELRSLHDEISPDDLRSNKNSIISSDEQDDLTKSKLAILSKLCKTLVESFIPFVCSIIDAVYGERNLLDSGRLGSYFDDLYDADEDDEDEGFGDDEDDVKLHQQQEEDDNHIEISNIQDGDNETNKNGSAEEFGDSSDENDAQEQNKNGSDLMKSPFSVDDDDV